MYLWYIWRSKATRNFCETSHLGSWKVHPGVIFSQNALIDCLRCIYPFAEILGAKHGWWASRNQISKRFVPHYASLIWFVTRDWSGLRHTHEHGLPCTLMNSRFPGDQISRFPGDQISRRSDFSEMRFRLECQTRFVGNQILRFCSDQIRRRSASEILFRSDS